MSNRRVTCRLSFLHGALGNKASGLGIVLAFLSLIGVERACGQGVEPLETWTGFIQPALDSEVAFADSGILAEVLVTVGQKVKQGDVLAKLDDDLQLSQLRIAESQAAMHGAVDAARAEHLLQIERTQVLRALGPEGVSRPHELARAAADLELAAGRLLHAEEEAKLRGLELERARLQLSRRTLRAPFSGIVTTVHYQIGENVTSFEPAMVRLIATSKMVAEINVPSNTVERVRANPVLRVLIGSSREPVLAKIRWISPVIEGGSGTVKVQAEFDNPEDRFLAGESCTASLHKDDGSQQAARLDQRARKR